jgi:hypothetical protein
MKQTNSEWLRTVIGKQNAEGSLLLIGGCRLTDFRVRIAQSQVRRDLLPSFWSHVAIINNKEKNGGAYRLYEISLEPKNGFGVVPKNNAVQEGVSSTYDDQTRYPNIAWLKFPVSPSVLQRDTTVKKSRTKNTAAAKTLREAIDENVDQFRKRRGLLDMPAMVTEWLAFAWGVSDRTNPIVKSIGVPSAVFVEAIYAMLGIELTPGLATQSSCPEAIWQAALWWQDFYASSASLTSASPSGQYMIRQPEAAARE